MTSNRSRPVVHLVNMPYAQLATPSVAVGILRACLEKARMPTHALDAQVLFAERIGPGFYSFLIGGFPYLLGEWTFAGKAFPDFEPDHELYLRRVAEILSKEDPARLVERLWECRETATEFVDDMAERIVESNPRIVGCTSVFQQHCASLALLRRVKELDPSVFTVIGGSNCEGPMGRATLVHFPWLDVVVSGDADDLIEPLCTTLIEDGPEIPAGKLGPGVFAHDHRRRWQAGEELEAERHVFQELDRSPVPNYDEYFETLALSPVSRAVFPGLPIETSRGCWWGQKAHCTFCGIEGGSMRFRSKSSKRVLREMDRLYAKYGIPRFKVVDLILDMNFFQDLFPKLADGRRDYTLFFEVKPNLSRDRVRMLKEAGVEWIQPGFESLHDGALKLMRKGNTAAINLQTLKWAREEGINVIWSILTEVPGEDPRWLLEMADMIDLLVHLQPPMGWNSIAFHRFSPYQTMPESFGLELAASWMHYFVYPLDPESMQGIAYRFQNVKDLELRPEGRPPIPGVEYELPNSEEALTLYFAIERWRHLFWTGVPPLLALTDFDDRCEILDTRPCARDQQVTLDGLSHRVYRACDSASTAATVARLLQEEMDSPPAVPEIETALADLVARGLMLEVGGRFLALATEGDVPRLPRGRAYPGGYVARKSDDFVLMSRDLADRRNQTLTAEASVAVGG